ncbi:magnesium chelatase [Psychroflexus maritimus]|uniref:Magnesium chelatase n=1 Tax=Psychroflexus maritimus TaxID=2714865 RepID=A0A967E231_9FLAO|nr:magnesium chelatase [Psychroflexus maritimus]NGZ89374.1 magnesium chelatase [Psychroflexus maritimus]
MNQPKIQTLGELKQANYTYQSVKDELRKNLIQNIKDNRSSFEGIIGFEDTVIPQIERAILSQHNINLLGLRGQAKTRIARAMLDLLDEWIPVVKGSSINDDPFQPVSNFAKKIIQEKGDETPVEWLHKSDRFAEKLATPDVSVADLIGDIDPIKAANLKLSYSDERVIHYGMIPRANRCIFVINELPDLQARIQVALFNILQEGDIQIRGFNLRLPLDLQFVFTANPEDYTNRGSIVTPLKDRIGSQILTHYPETIEIAKQITSQEAKAIEERNQHIIIPEVAKDLLEQISFEARKSEYVDVKSGVSARLSISALENLMSTAERRSLLNQDQSTSIRLMDFNGIIPAITGKIELLYEGEQAGADQVAEILLEKAMQSVFKKHFPEIKKLEKEGEKNEYSDIMQWFAEGNDIELLDNASNDEYELSLKSSEALNQFIKKHLSVANENFFKELVLWNLCIFQKLDKNKITNGYQFKDMLSDYLKNL